MNTRQKNYLYQLTQLETKILSKGANKMNKYEKRAKNFLKKTNTTINIEFEGYKTHFVGEETKRNIYKVTLENKRGTYIYKFGDSINNFEKCLKPTAYDVLACLTTYDPDTFKEFCSSYGYKITEVKPKIIYERVVKEYEGLTQIFTKEELILLSEIA